MKTQIYVPSRLIDIVNNIDIDQRLKNRAIEVWVYIYSEIIKNIDYTIHFYYNIPAEELKRFQLKIGTKRYNYKFFIDILKDNNLIEVNDSYSTNTFSKSYKLGADIFKIGYKFIEIDTKKILKGYKPKEYWLEKYPHLTNKINDIYNTNINMTDYITYLNTNKDTVIKKAYSKKYNCIIDKVLDNETIVNCIFEAMKINFKNIWIKESDEGRLYSSITNISATASNFFEINGEKLEEIDVKNCQPLLLSNLIKNEKYKTAVQSGTFYDEVANELNLPRQEAKIRLYKHVFFNDNTLCSGILFDALNSLYGEDLMDQINFLKRNSKLSCLLQKLESDIFINATNNKKGFVTKHDAILCSKNDVKLYKDILKEQFGLLNLKVKFG